MQSNHESEAEALFQSGSQYQQRMLCRFSQEECNEPAGRSGNDFATVLVGIRAAGSWSVYFDSDPVVQFNTQCELRRLFWQGEKYAASNGKLERLEQVPDSRRKMHQRLPVDDTTEQLLLTSCLELLKNLQSEIHKSENRLFQVDCYPDCKSVEEQVLGLIARVTASPLAIARAPASGC